MNLGLSTRSALVRAAETGLRRERFTRRMHDSAMIFAVCAIVVGAYLLVQLIAQVLPA
ncbi:MAG: hypothetical protein ROZ09_15085 [Thiobacillus sp.]|jgi:hypothetical protein|uniref:hypothetical protein n=1 Tax=Thiobacillus sp. TaxID=924 RepID=UPI002895FF9D|nr:hypothetical protein [Thiobacillus sp.]MDT3708145.1 hypothetical protein [Thiobacillus sp.]